MARNIEIKARIASVESLLPSVAALASEGPVEIAQQDTFFRCEAGRLKLRDFLNGTGELIFYRRANQAGPKESFYLRSETSTPEILRQSLALAYGESGSVSKQRTLFLVGRTRVHLDKVQGLGHFLELEVVLSENESSEVGTGEAHELMAKLGIESHQLVEGAYVELASEKASELSIEGKAQSLLRGL
ncbi:MAG: class IV adenylate cyclase [Rubrivivax sp.]